MPHVLAKTTHGHLPPSEQSSQCLSCLPNLPAESGDLSVSASQGCVTILRRGHLGTDQAGLRFGNWRVSVLLNCKDRLIGKKSGVRPRPGKKGRPCLHRSPATQSNRDQRRDGESHGSNDAWNLDFVDYQWAEGYLFRAFTVIDGFTQECLAVEASASLRGSIWSRDSITI